VCLNVVCLNVVCLNGSHVSPGVARVLIHSQVATQGTGAVNVHLAEMATYGLSTSTFNRIKLLTFSARHVAHVS
jgi:hypothetical protein